MRGERSRRASETDAGGPLRVLVVDDSPDDRFTYVRLLSRRPREFSVEESATVADAIERCRSAPPDCLLLDYNLPDGTGLQVVETLRDGGLEVPTVMLTGQGNEEVAVAAMKRGVQDYLVKGAVSRESLEGAVRSAVEKVRLRRELEEQRQALVESHRELERFACMVAHDLQNPLSSMRMVLTVLRRVQQDGDPQAQELVDRALESSDRMRRMISDLLEYSRAGGRSHPLGDVDLARLAREVRRGLQALIDETGAEVDVGELPVVRGDRAQLGQVLQNLVENAIRYHGDRPPRVRLTGAREGGEMVLRVADEGIGIAAEHRGRIFEPFERLHAYDEIPGNGLGLAICRKVVEYHGGTIDFESEPGRGTTFVVRLPAA